MRVIRVGNNLYVYGSKQYLQKSGAGSSRFQGKWLQLPVTTLTSIMPQLFTPGEFLTRALIPSAALRIGKSSDPRMLAIVETATVRSSHFQIVLTVAARRPHLPSDLAVTYDGSTAEQVGFYNFDRPVTIEPPRSFVTVKP